MVMKLETVNIPKSLMTLQGSITVPSITYSPYPWSCPKCNQSHLLMLDLSCHFLDHVESKFISC